MARVLRQGLQRQYLVPSNYNPAFRKTKKIHICESCGKLFSWWLLVKKQKWMKVNPDGEFHFKTCGGRVRKKPPWVAEEPRHRSAASRGGDQW